MWGVCMAENLLTVALRSFAYADCDETLHEISFDVKKGEFILLTGASGCGKSTLLRLINGIIPAYYDGNIDGNITFRGKCVETFAAGDLARYMGTVFQDPKDQFFSTIVEDEIALVGENLGMEHTLLTHRVEELLTRFALTKLRNHSLRQLSGGEKQKVAIASTLVYDADLILFDEPSASLDYASILKLRVLLQELKEAGKTIIVCEHRLFYLTDLCDRLVFMKDGAICGDYPQKALNQTLQKQLQVRSFSEEQMKGEHDASPGTPCVYVKDLDVIAGRRRLMQDVTFSLAKGEVMAVLGRNGIGKSTMASMLAGLSRVKKGTISVGKTRKERLHRTFYVLQDADSQLFFDSVENEILLDRRAPDFLSEAKRCLMATDLWEKRLLFPQTLSTGEKQRLTVICGILETCDLLILDEPTAGLDFKRMNQIASLILEKSESVPVMLITHDVELLLRVANTALLCSEEQQEKIPVVGNERRIINFLKQNAGVI